ncbi:hypothetical protein Spiaf_2161 [Spirochaeta africana DSM 8902]|uniref:Uncharacterized protein n=2 Tax=Spirochaeta TaxID=146 RepID=H9UL06_SPIAZ|nr:hypothetical protein Spiaf_2161 [Spirochaeta africana DSM 8902]
MFIGLLPKNRHLLSLGVRLGNLPDEDSQQIARLARWPLYVMGVCSLILLVGRSWMSIPTILLLLLGSIQHIEASRWKGRAGIYERGIVIGSDIYRFRDIFRAEIYPDRISLLLHTGERVDIHPHNDSSASAQHLEDQGVPCHSYDDPDACPSPERPV